MTAVAELTLALSCLTVLVVALAAAIATRRALRRQRAAARARRAAPARPWLVQLAAGEPDEQAEAAAHLAALDAGTWRVVEPGVVALLTKVRGDARAAVVALLADRGVIGKAQHDLHRRGAVRRARAAELLGAAGTGTAVHRLVELVRDRDLEVRLVAARALGRVGAPAAAWPLLEALEGPSPSLPAPVVAQALLRIGPPATGAVEAALLSPSALVRATAAEVLGRLGTTSATTALVAALAADPVAEVRARAASALGRLGMPAAVGPLASARGDADARVAAEAATALAALGADGPPVGASG